MRCNSHFASLWKTSTALFYLGLLLVTAFPSVTCKFLQFQCKNTANNGSRFSTEGLRHSIDLNMVIDDLLPYFYSRITPNNIYVLRQCIGNISSVQCSNCSREAVESLEKKCLHGIGGQVWMDKCFLRYDNFSFSSIVNMDGFYLDDTQDFRGNSQAFRSATSSLLSNMSDFKAYIPGSKEFSLDSRSYSSTTDEVSSHSVYGLVQCWGNISIKDCQKCLFRAMQTVKNHSFEKQGAQILYGSCTLQYQIHPFFPGPPPAAGGTLVNGTSQLVSKKSSKNLPIILGFVGMAILVLFICFLYALWKRVNSAISENLVTTSTQNEEIHQNAPDLRLIKHEENFIFSFESLKEATENFNENNKLGEGGFGAVYKGTTTDGKEIAIKRLCCKKSKRGKKEFMNEMELLASVEHRNIVNLLGCCVERDERLLVCEYLPNKSLDTFLFNPDPQKRRKLDWEKRYNIAIGIARGLLYLHEHSPLRIIHRDIKASNILLDEKLNPKIADFGLAVLFTEDEMHIQTKIAGTCGYMAPEYAMRGHLSAKADVYSFGVLLLEIVSGRKNTEINLFAEKQSMSVLEWVWRRKYDGGDILSMIDSALIECCRYGEMEEEAFTCIHVGLLCIQADAAARPAMSNVISMILANVGLQGKPAYTMQIES